MKRFKLKDEDGLYKNWVPLAIVGVVIIYCLLLVFLAFPAIDAKFGK